MPALVNVLTILGWIAILIGVVVLVWDFIANRVVSRAGLAAIVVGIVLLLIGYLLPSLHGPTTVEYDGLAAVTLSV